MIYQTGRDIESYVDQLTGGKGRDWMLHTLGNTKLVHGDWSDSHNETYPGFGHATIKLGQSWLSHAWGAKENLAHEFGHVWDINTGNYLGIGGGPADDLTSALGGHPYRSLCRWCTGEPDPNNPPGLWTIHSGYGNESINDYFAEGFVASVYNEPMPPGVNDWIVDQITYEATFIP